MHVVAVVAAVVAVDDEDGVQWRCWGGGVQWRWQCSMAASMDYG